MENAILKQAVDRAFIMGPAVLMQGMHFRRPSDVVGARSLLQDDKGAILAAWASNLYAVDSKLAVQCLPGSTETVSIGEVQAALRELDRRGQS